MRRLVLAVVVVAAGCASDPCSGVAGTCISARVQGSASGLDQLRVILDGAAQPQVSPATPSAFSLPVRVAIVLPASVTSPATLTVEGVAGGQTVATSGPQSVSFTSGAHQSFTFDLAAGGTADLSAEPSDMASVAVPGHVTVYPTTLSFPTTPRGGQSAAQILTVYNRTGMMVSTVALDMAGAGGGGGDFKPMGVSPSSCMLTQNGITVPADVDCQVQIVFTPTASGMRTGSVPLVFGNGDGATVSFSGQATPVWSAEGPGGGALMRAVWGTSGVAYSVGGVISGGVWTSLTPGQWNFQNFGSASWASVAGADSSHVWAGGDGGLYTIVDGGGWQQQTIAPNDAGFAGEISGVWAASPTEAWAVSVAGQILHYSGGAWALAGVDSVAPLHAISGSAAGVYVVVGDNGHMAVPMAGGGFSPVPTNTTAALRGVWEQSATNIFAVGDSGTIVHCTGASMSCIPETSPMSGNLSAISGRTDPNTMQLDVWAVGALGNVVLHSTGNGQWTAVTVPNNAAMNGVFVLPSGEVYAVGTNGEVNHYY